MPSVFTCICGVALVLLMVGVVAVIARPSEDSPKRVHRRSVPECDFGSYFSSESHGCQPCTSCGKGTSVDSCEFFEGPGECVPCDNGWYQDEDNYKDPSCKPCLHCRNRVLIQKCTRTSNSVCGDCKPGYYLHRRLGTCERCSSVRGKMPDACKPKTTPAPALAPAPAPIEIREPTGPPSLSEKGAQSTQAVTTSLTEISSSPTSTEMSEILTVTISPRVSTDEGVTHLMDTLTNESAVIVGGVTTGVATGASKISPGPGVNFFLTMLAVVILIVTFFFLVKLVRRHIVFLIYGRNPEKSSQVSSTHSYSTVEMQECGDEAGENQEIYQEETFPCMTDQEENGEGNHAAAPPDGDMDGSSGDEDIVGSIVPGSDCLAALVMVLQGEIDNDFFEDFVKYCISSEKLTPHSAERIKDFAGCVNTIKEANDMDLIAVMTMVFTVAKLKGKTSICKRIKQFIPDVCTRPQKSTSGIEDGGNNYLKQLETSLRQNNLQEMKFVDLKELGTEIGALVEKEVKGCGDIYAIAVDLKVRHETAHTLRHFESLESVLRMQAPDLEVINFAEVLLKHRRVAAVKRICKMLR